MTRIPRVLVVEDDLHTQQAIEKILTRDLTLRNLSLEVVTASDGEQALSLFKSQSFDLIITDLLMPKVDGFKLVEAVRADEKGKNLPVLVLSAIFRDRQGQQRLERDFRVQVQNKPFSARDLANRVFTMLRPKNESARGSSPSLAGPSAPSRGSSPSMPTQRRSPSSPGLRAPSPELLKAVLDFEVPEATPAVPIESRPRLSAAQPLAKESRAVTAVRPALSAPPAASPPPRHSAPEEPDLDGAVGNAAPAAPVAAPARAIQGSLVERPVALLLLHSCEVRFSGTLDLRRGKVRKLIYLLSGHPIYVQSNQRSETLGQMLVRRGGLSAEQNVQALALSKQESIKYGEALVRLGYMTEGQVMAELVAQTRLKIESCLPWRSGSYAFVEDATVGHRVPQCTLEPIELVFSGLKRHPNPDDAFTRLASRGSHVLATLPRLETFRDGFSNVFGRLVLDALVPGVSVAQLIRATGSPQDAVLQIDALLQAGMIELQSSAAAAEPLVSGREAITVERLAVLAPEREAPAEPTESMDENSAVIVIPRDLIRAPSPPTPDPEKVQLALQLIQATYLGLHDADHYQVLGVAPQSDRESVEVAYRIKRKQFDLANFRDMDLGEQHSHLDEICLALDEAHAVLGDPARRSQYDQARKSHPEDTERVRALRAESLCREAEDLFDRQLYGEASAAFAKASQIDDQAEYRAMYALAHFLASGESPLAAEESMVEVQTALANNPDEPAAYLVAAKISRAMGHNEEALQHLRRLLPIDPTCREAFDELETILLESNDAPALETEYRRVIHLLGGQDAVWAGELWRRLGLLYRDRLKNPERARTAAEASLRLSPGDRVAQSLLADLDHHTPERWPEAVLGYRSLWRGEPSVPAPLHQLFGLHLKAGRTDAAFLAASAAELRGCASAEERAYVEQHRPKFLRRAARALEPSLWESLRHPNDDPGLATLFRVLTPVIQKTHPLRLEDFGLGQGDLVEESLLPETFAATLRYSAMELGIPVPLVALRPQLGQDVQAIGVDPATLLVGAAALEEEDRFELCFRLSRALTLISPGRIVASGRRRQVLRAHILAGLSSAFPQLEVPDPDGLVAEIVQVLRGFPHLQPVVMGAVASLRQRLQRLNLSEWQQGVQRTADRVGLLLCTDLLVAGRVLSAQDETAALDVVDFALSEIHGELRASLELSVS